MGTTMPIGPNGEKRPQSTVANAVLVGKIATGLAKEEYVDAKPEAETLDRIAALKAKTKRRLKRRTGRPRSK